MVPMMTYYYIYILQKFYHIQKYLKGIPRSLYNLYWYIYILYNPYLIITKTKTRSCYTMKYLNVIPTTLDKTILYYPTAILDII